MRYVGAILISGASLWVLITVRMLISPPTYADICGDPAAMCCVLCAAIAWFSYVPMLGFVFALILFLPGHLLVSWIARKVAWWRPVYWIAAWAVTAAIAAVLFQSALTIADRKIVALIINNGIVATMAPEFIVFAIVFVVFGLLCGFCYWLMPVRAARTAGQ